MRISTGGDRFFEVSVEVERVERKEHDSKRVGEDRVLSENEIVGGIPCKKETWVRYHSTGKLRQVTLVREWTDPVQKITCKANSEVHFYPNSRIEWISPARESLIIQGIPLRGQGAYSSFEVTFYDNGKLKAGVLSQDYLGIPKNSIVEFHPNGKIRMTQLSGDALIQGIPFKRGETILFREGDGKPYRN